MVKPERNADGTFPKGKSGNPAGRPAKTPASHRMPAHNRRSVFEVAEMPVQVRKGDKLVEASGYQAVLMSVMKRALEGHGPSARLFLDQVRFAAQVNGEQNEFTQWLVEEHGKLMAREDKLRALLPKTGGGVVIQQPDGSYVPAGLAGRVDEIARILEEQDEE